MLFTSTISTAPAPATIWLKYVPFEPENRLSFSLQVAFLSLLRKANNSLSRSLLSVAFLGAFTCPACGASGFPTSGQ